MIMFRITDYVILTKGKSEQEETLIRRIGEVVIGRIVDDETDCY